MPNQIIGSINATADYNTVEKRGCPACVKEFLLKLLKKGFIKMGWLQASRQSDTGAAMRYGFAFYDRNAGGLRPSEELTKLAALPD